MKHSSNLSGKAVYVVDGLRTPFLKAKGIGPFSASDLAVQAGRSLLQRQPFLPKDLDEVVVGCVMAGPDEVNIARMIALRLGCGDKVPAYTVMRNCASGMQAIDSAAIRIAGGHSHLVLAGGTEAMSHAPVLFNQQMVSWLNVWSSAKTFSQKVKLLTQLRPAHFAPIIGLLRGLNDPIVNLSMGQTAENLAYQFQITREQMDEFANTSHHRVAQAYAEGKMEEVIPIIDPEGRAYHEDDGYRKDSSMEGLAKLKPFFDRPYGMVTAGNSSQITDGACFLILASAEAVKKYHLPVIGRILDSQWSGLDPKIMGLGPVYAATPILERQHLKPQDIDAWEINEAFSAQVLACLKAWDDPQFCSQELGVKKPYGAPSLEALNPEGGAIAIGHPVGASGARIVLHLLTHLAKTGGQRGMASICIGGGQGGAMYLERITEVNES
jgi:acetyl-CoA C-acetyltransferase